MVSMSANFNSDLQEYFENHVQISRDERKSALKIANKVIDAIAAEIHDADDRFSKSLIHVGSHYQGLKTEATDEFDINVQLLGIGNVQWADVDDPSITYGFLKMDDDKAANATNRKGLHIVEKPRKLSPDIGCGWLKLSPVSSERYRDLMYKEHLVPYLVKQKFGQLLAVSCERMRGVTLMQKPHGPAFTITIHSGQHDCLDHDVDVDFAPTIRAQLPLKSCFGWPRQATYSWLPEELIDSIKSKGINLVCKKNFFWTYSFSEMEKELSRHVGQFRGDCKKKVHRIMKVLFKNQWHRGAGLSSYHLKNAWLWYSEDNQQLPWSDAFIGIRFYECTVYFMECLFQKQLPQYFNVKNNLLQGKEYLTETAENIEAFLKKV